MTPTSVELNKAWTYYGLTLNKNFSSRQWLRGHSPFVLGGKVNLTNGRSITQASQKLWQIQQGHTLRRLQFSTHLRFLRKNKPSTIQMSVQKQGPPAWWPVQLQSKYINSSIIKTQKTWTNQFYPFRQMNSPPSSVVKTSAMVEGIR